MKSAVFIPVRLDSTRLPEKALKDLCGKLCIQRLIERVKRAKKPDIIVLCTTTNQEDDKLIEIVKKMNIEYFRGSQMDVLSRYNEAAKKFDVEFIINVDGDDIFCDPMLIDKTLEKLISSKYDFLLWEGIVFGVAPIGLKTKALIKICEKKMTQNTETGWSKFFTDTGICNVSFLKSNDPNLNDKNIRLTLDYEEDLKLFREIYKNLHEPFSTLDIVKLLHERPDLQKINENVKEKYKENFIKKSASILIKND